MDDLIKREDAINHCEIWRERAKDHKDRDGWWMADNLLRLMKDIPIAEPKSGEWVDEHENGHGYWVGTCNQCGKENCVDNFCPNCGAQMKGADDE